MVANPRAVVDGGGELELKKNPYGGHGKAPGLGTPTTTPTTSTEPENPWATLDIDPDVLRDFLTRPPPGQGGNGV
jgi:hypothetical protein